METRGENIILLEKYRWLLHLVYWMLAAALLFFVFSNRSYDVGIRASVVGALTLMSIGVTYFVNYYLVPRFLFEGRYLRFFYLLLYSVVISVWVSYLSILYIIWTAATHSPRHALPDSGDVVLLLSGSYLIILFATFIHFVKETYKRLMERNGIARQKSEMELKLQEARLKLLQGQLHPHFLFNMLNNLYGLWMENSNATPEVILKLSNLLDFMLYECNQERIPLGSEVAFIRNYIDLERLRHDSRLKLEVDLPHDDGGVEVAPLLFFSFVENAFKHGANKNSGESHISIGLTVSGTTLTLVVANNYSTLATAEGKGIGMKNVEERLNMLYPEKHSLMVNNGDGVFTVTLRLETA